MTRPCTTGMSWPDTAVAVNPPRQEEVDAPPEAAAVAAGEVPATAQAEPAAADAAAGDDKGKEKKGDKK